MTGPPATRIAADRLAAFAAALLRAAGMPAAAAARMAAILLHADMRGMSTHGLALLPGYLGRMASGAMDPAAAPRLVRTRGAVLAVDGGNGPGQLAVAFAMEHAIARAREVGIAAAAVGRSNHCGAMAFYAMQALPHGMIGIALTNSMPTMAWVGGLDRILGMNPIGVAIPAGAEAPIVLDTSFAATSRGRILQYAERGETLPEGWATDAEGRATVDPAAALAGLILPAGGHKGAGLALVAGILAAVLSGAAYGTELGDLEAGPRPAADGQLVLALDIAAFEEPERFGARIDGIIRQIRASRRAPGVDRVVLPGERAAEAEARARAEGVPLSAALRAALAAAAGRLGVDAALLGD